MMLEPKTITHTYKDKKINLEIDGDLYEEVSNIEGRPLEEILIPIFEEVIDEESVNKDTL